MEMKSSIKQKWFSAKQGKTGPSLMGAWADTTGSTQQKRSTTITQPKTFHSGGKLFKNQNSTLFLTLLKTTRLENLFPIKRKWARQRLVWSWHFLSLSSSDPSPQSSSPSHLYYTTIYYLHTTTYYL